MSLVVLCTAAALAATPIRLEEVREASRHATTAQLAELDRLRAQQELRQTRAGVLPQVGLNGGVSYTAIGAQRYLQAVPAGVDEQGNLIFREEVIDVEPTSRQNYQLGIGLNQSVFDPVLWAQLKAAGARVDAAAEQSREDQLGAELEGINRFFTLLRSQTSAAVTEKRVKTSEEFAQRADALFKAGRRRKEDAISALINLENDRAALLRAQLAVADAQGRLAAWIGRPAVSALEAVSPADLGQAKPHPTLDDAMATAREHRPYLRALNALTEAAEEAVSGSRAAHLPTVSAGLSYGRASPTASIFVDPARQHAVTGRLDVRWDLFSGFATDAQIQQAVIAHKRARLQQAQAEADLAAEIRTRLLQLGAQQALVEASDRQLALANDNLRLAQIRFEEGVGSTLEIRDAQVKHSAAELNAAESRMDLELARAAFERAIGAMAPGVSQ